MHDKDLVTLGNGDEEILSEFDELVSFVDGRISCKFAMETRNDVPDALRTTLKCLQIFSDAGMLLRKWRPNSKQLNLLWQQDGVETEYSETSAIDLRPPIKVFGLAWDSEKDLIYFDPKDLLKFMSRKVAPKISILSVVGRTFNILEFLAYSL
ncbi:DUF1758 domain-containing protein [Trichonephila clavata]|uniref:DUF1758 domain-containing protein n=1 Tax=Trichonephila clavata TaxID=2740835 RepID=A0A8X6F0F0_TRICU|nr:DUF1758 domain-containing protein [Trichonephila clavata]